MAFKNDVADDVAIKNDVADDMASVWPRRAPRLATPSGPRRAPRLAPSGTPSGPVGHPVWPPSSTPSGRRRVEKKFKKINKFFFGCCCWLEKRAKNISVFGFQSPRSPSSPSSAGFAGKAARRRRFFWPSSPSHPSELYSSLGWLNSKVPKPFFPFTLRLIDVDGF
jgi:hypothetical protein